MNGEMVMQLNLPEYIYQPQKLIRHFLAKGHAIKRQEIVDLPWKLAIEVDTSEDIGRILSHHRIFELPVVEALFRLIDPDDFVLDAGANIGYMTAAALSAGAARVISFEPTHFFLPVSRGMWNTGIGSRISPDGLMHGVRQ